MTLPKIDDNGLTNALWRSRIDGGIDQINTNTTAIATNASNIASNDTDIATNASNIASNLTKINTLEETVLTSNKTVNIAAGSSASTIQGLINDQPKNLNGYKITFQFAGSRANPQTYDLGTTQLYWDGFHGGEILVQGNSAETPTNRTAQEIADGKPALGVKIQTQNVNASGAMFFQKCTQVFVEHLEFEQNGTGTNSDILRMYYNTFGVIQYCIITNTNTKGNDGVYYHQAHGTFAYNRVSNLDTVLKASSGSNVSMLDIDLYPDASPLVAPNHKLQSQGGSIVTQGGNINFDATVSQVYINSGGVVTPREGFIFDEHILQLNKTVNFDNSMSVSDMQDLIDDQPKNLNGHTLTFQFANGTYTFGTNQLLWSGFEGGTLLVQGNMSDSNTQNLSVTINGTRGNNSGVFEFYECYRPYLGRIEFIQNGTNNDTNIVEMDHCDAGMIENCLFQNTGTQANDAIDINNSTTRVVGCYFDNLVRNIMSGYNSRVYVQGTHTKTGGTDASTAHLFSNLGSIITQDATQAGGGTFKASGGLIFTTNGSDPSTETNTTNISTNATNIATNTSNIASNLTKINADILQASTTIAVHAVNDVRVTGHHTINYTSLQTAINALPKNMSGHSITIQFQNGTYDFGTTQISVISFTGGIFSILGNQSDSGSGTYNVILQGQNSGGNGIFYCKQCQDVVIRFLEFQHTGSGQSNYLVKGQASNVIFYRCKFTRTATGNDNSRGIQIFDSCNARISECHFSSLIYAIYAQQNSSVTVISCHDYGTKPVNGVFAVEGAIVKPMYTDIHSSTSNYGASSGGLITHKSGVILEETILQADKTVRFAASDSSQSDKDNADVVFTGAFSSSNVTTLQNIINDQPKNLNGHNLTIQFADGTYDFETGHLTFTGFEGGFLNVQGNLNETPNADGGGLGVIIRSKKTGDQGALFFQHCSNATVNRIRFEQNGSNTDTILLRFFYGTQGTVSYSSFTNLNGTQNNRAIYYHESEGMVRDCKFNNFNNNVNSIMNSRVFSRNTATFSGSGNDQDATNNIRSEYGSITTQAGTQAGGTAFKSNGGVIFNSSGALV